MHPFEFYRHSAHPAHQLHLNVLCNIGRQAGSEKVCDTTDMAPVREKIEKRWALDHPEPAESATDKDLAVDDDLLKRQSTPIVEEGEADLLSRE